MSVHDTVTKVVTAVDAAIKVSIIRDERTRSESAYLRPLQDERCVNSNTFTLYMQVVL